jgi:hypothetical protein
MNVNLDVRARGIAKKCVFEFYAVALRFWLPYSPSLHLSRGGRELAGLEHLITIVETEKFPICQPLVYNSFFLTKVANKLIMPSTFMHL